MTDHSTLNDAQHIAERIATLTSAPYRANNWHIPCPNCGKEPKGKQTHFSFNAKGGYCFVCGEGIGLAALYAHVTGSATKPALSPAPVVPAKPRAWQSNPEHYLYRYTTAADRISRWQAYRPFTLDTIARYELGVGILPAVACDHRRLIYPIRRNGQIVALRGRAFESACHCPKWLSAGGSKAALFGIELIRPGCTLVIPENPCDAMLAMQQDSRYVSVASTAGIGTWLEDWSRYIAAQRIKLALIWADNDLAGWPNQETFEQLVREWRSQNPKARRPPEPKGPKIAAELKRYGVAVAGYVWPNGTPPKADLGWGLMQEVGQSNAGKVS